MSNQNSAPLPPESAPAKKSSRLKTEGRRVGLLPERGWAKRNYQYLSGSFLPSLMQKREETGTPHPPEFRDLEGHEVEVVWIGHASFLVRTAGFNVLIDPVWAKWVGPLKRHRDPGIDIEHLPPIDLVLITHAHFDHLCRMTLKRIVDGSQTVLVPHGVGPVLKKLKTKSVIEMTDWEIFEFGGAKIHFTPAHHWGARYIHDTHKGFGGYVIELPDHTVYHSGDSAYFDGFREIGEKHSIDTALLPIGAYDCPSGREVHMNPEEAVQAFFDLNAAKMIPMHHATFPISNEHRHEPLQRLHCAIEEHDLNDRVISPHEGEQVILSSRPDNQATSTQAPE
ncbi:MBL fold metallo-hydrolase [Verrucomicrobiales bacterium BCK34]|nr:MBL fold metallo-hydrolase [Verrucomicrobiales bacterium BCK34]